MNSKNKFIILRALKNSSEDIKSMTVGQLINKINKENKEQDLVETEEFNKVYNVLQFWKGGLSIAHNGYGLF